MNIFIKSVFKFNFLNLHSIEEKRQKQNITRLSNIISNKRIASDPYTVKHMPRSYFINSLYALPNTYTRI